MKNVVHSCKIYCEIKTNFHKPAEAHLIKDMQPFDRLSIDFKGPLPTRTKNNFLLNSVDEYSRYVFSFLCAECTSITVIKCFTSLFSIFGMPNFVQ